MILKGQDSGTWSGDTLAVPGNSLLSSIRCSQIYSARDDYMIGAGSIFLLIFKGIKPQDNFFALIMYII